MVKPFGCQLALAWVYRKGGSGGGNGSGSRCGGQFFRHLLLFRLVCGFGGGRGGAGGFRRQHALGCLNQRELVGCVQPFADASVHRCGVDLIKLATLLCAPLGGRGGLTGQQGFIGQLHDFLYIVGQGLVFQVLVQHFAVGRGFFFAGGLLPDLFDQLLELRQRFLVFAGFRIGIKAQRTGLLADIALLEADRRAGLLQAAVDNMGGEIIEQARLVAGSVARLRSRIVEAENQRQLALAVVFVFQISGVRRLGKFWLVLGGVTRGQRDSVQTA